MLDNFVIMEIQLMKMDAQTNVELIQAGSAQQIVLNNLFVLQYVEMVKLMEKNY